MSTMRRVLTAAIVAAALPLAPAAADVAGPDDSIGQAFGPLAAGTSYSGRFRTPADVDYLAFDVARAGQTLRFDVANTVRDCSSPNLTGCPLYATLIDGEGRQLGGEGSSAGTGQVTEYSPLDGIDWTFEAAGRHYLAMDSDGDLPTYALRYHEVAQPAGGAPGTGSGAGAEGGVGSPSAADPPVTPPIASLRVAPRQRGAVVSARLRIGRPLRTLTVRLERAGSRRASPALAVQRVTAPGPGRRTVRLRLNAVARRALAARGRLAVRLRVVAVPVTGSAQTLLRAVRVVRR